MPKRRRVKETAVTYDPLIVPPLPVVPPHEHKEYSDSCVDGLPGDEDGAEYDGDDNPVDDADMARFDLEDVIERVRFMREAMRRDPRWAGRAIHAHAAHCYLTAAHTALEIIANRGDMDVGE